jgi:predicted DNA-binding transcriptional regulator AlpA
MKKTVVPESVVNAINALLEPYKIAVDIDQLLKKNDPKEGTKKFITIKDVEKTYSLGRWTLYRAIKAGVLNAIKLTPGSRSGKVLIEVKSLDAWLRQCQTHVG